MTDRRLPTRPELLVLAIILTGGLGLRLLWMTAPLLDAHRWRQVDTAGIARSLYEDRFNVFYPRVNWGGRTGYVESEFPLLPATVAVLYKIFGEHDYIGRLVVAGFSVGAIVLMFGLGAELLGPAGGLAAAFLFAVSPAAVFFGRTFMPDSVMLFFWLASLWAFIRYLRTNQRRALWLASAAMGVACLVKIPAVLMLAPLVGAALHERGWKILRDRAFLIAVTAPLLMATLWYVHAFNLYRQTGLTFGILVQPARTYPPSIAPGPWTTAFSKWSNLRVLGSSDYYFTLLARLYTLLLLPFGFAGAVIGAALWKREDGRVILDLWLLAFLAFVLVMGEANIGHEYYQLPVVPIGALYFAAFAAPAFERVLSGPRAGYLPAISLSIALTIAGGIGFYYSGVINSHFRPDNPDTRVVQAGDALDRATPKDALFVVVDDYGVTSPLLLYYAHRKGWSFDIENLSPKVIDGLYGKGARYFVSTVWSRFAEQRPEAAEYLSGFQRVDLRDEPDDTRAFDLNRRIK